MDFYYELHKESRTRAAKYAYMVGHLAQQVATLTKRTYEEVREEAERSYEDIGKRGAA